MKNLKITVLLISALIITSCNSTKSTSTKSEVSKTVTFNIDLNDRSDDTFKVTVTAPKLTEENNIFQFASTAPGTYITMDVGRFIRSFTAYDKNGNELESNHISTNQFELLEPKKVHTIKYEIAETFDNPVDENPIYVMCGTSIEDDHALINGQAIFGYFKGLQASSMNIIIEYPEEWTAGTALKLNTDNSYTANNFDHAVDSPILLGNLTKATTNIEGTAINIYTYSSKDMINSDQVLETIESMLKSASKFLNGLPVNEYTFLLFFETNTLAPKGAWEHSYSSEYVYNEKAWDEISQGFKDTAAHEFFHIVTPLNIHSEIIQEFNFIEPIASRHLWLYESTTEWVSDMMQLRTGEKTLEDYFSGLRRKVYISTNYFDNTYSLLDLSLNSFTSKEAHKQYPNVYMNGAVTIGLLDIKLLELSDGKRGMREVMNELAQKYGSKTPFDDATFFDTFVDFTYPEIAEFMELYIKNATPLPLKEYYQKIGIEYNDVTFVFGLDENATDEQIVLREHWMKAL